MILGTKERQGADYTDLSKIAPTILTEGDDWKLNLREHGEALGRTNDAEALLTDWDNRLARVKRTIGDRKISVTLAGGKQLGPVGKMVLDDLGIGTGTGGVEVIHLRAGESGSAPVACSRPARRWRTWREPSSSSPAPLGEHPHLADDKRGSMSTQLLDALSRLAARRFGSFADAATQVFDLLESACPGGNLVLGQIDWDEGKCRVIDARGDGVPRGAVIPLAPWRAGQRVRRRRSCSTPARSRRSARRTGSLRPWTRPTAASSDVLLATGPGGEAAVARPRPADPRGRPAALVRVGEHLGARRAAPARRAGARPREHRSGHRAAEPRDAWSGRSSASTS